MTTIRLHNVSKVYTTAGRPAVDTVSLDVADGRVTVLKGPSGSGKTTLLSLVGCMARPSTGRIFFGDKEVTSLPERFLAQLRCRSVGFVFQNYNLIKGISVLENVILPALPIGGSMSVLRRRAADLLDQVGIGSLISTPVHHLSGGEQQRVAIARALINSPDLVIADEPTAHLDTDRSEQFMDIIAGLKSEGRTVLMASHDPVVFSHSLVEDVVSMHDGRILDRAAAAS